MLFVSTGSAISNVAEDPTSRFFSASATIEIGEGKLTITESASLQYDVFGSFTGDDPSTVTGTVTGIRILESADGVAYFGNGWLYPSTPTTWESIRNMTYSELFLGDDHMEGGRFDDQLAGYGGNDYLWGRQANDALFGGAGNDVVIGGTGDDTMSGGEGVDTVSYSGAEGGVRVDLNIVGVQQDTGDHGIDMLEGFENVTGGEFADNLFGDEKNNTVRGSGGNDVLRGRGGKDVLEGGKGHDTLLGGAGNDTLTGGAGNDVFNFSNGLNGTNNVDTITDFVTGADTIELDNDFFTAFGFVGDPIHGGFFHAGTAAVNPDQRIIYDANTGSLYYDADGSGAGAQVRFAMLGAGTAIDFSDFTVVE